MNKFEFELFLMKQQAVINLHKMSNDSRISSGVIGLESDRVFDIRLSPIWLDDDSHVLNIMGL